MKPLKESEKASRLGDTQRSFEVESRVRSAFGGEPFPFEDVEVALRPRVQLLRQIFGEAPYPYVDLKDTSGLPHEEIFHWYHDLHFFVAPVMRYVLPRLLVDLLWKYPNEARYSDSVVRFLQGPALYGPTDRKIMEEDPSYREFLVHHDSTYVPEKYSKLHSFSQDQ